MFPPWTELLNVGVSICSEPPSFSNSWETTEKLQLLDTSVVCRVSNFCDTYVDRRVIQYLMEKSSIDTIHNLVENIKRTDTSRHISRYYKYVSQVNTKILYSNVFPLMQYDNVFISASIPDKHHVPLNLPPSVCSFCCKFVVLNDVT